MNMAAEIYFDVVSNFKDIESARLVATNSLISQAIEWVCFEH